MAMWMEDNGSSFLVTGAEMGPSKQSVKRIQNVRVRLKSETEEVTSCQSVNKPLLLLLSHSVMSDSATRWTAARQTSLSVTISWSLLKLMSIGSVMHPTISSSVVPFSSCPQSLKQSEKQNKVKVSRQQPEATSLNRRKGENQSLRSKMKMIAGGCWQRDRSKGTQNIS